MKKDLVAAAIAFLAFHAPTAVAGQVIGSISSPRGIPNQGQPVFVFNRHSRLPYGYGVGFCCYAPEQPSASVIVLPTPAGLTPPPPAPVVYMPPTVEKTSQGVTIVRGPPIPP